MLTRVGRKWCALWATLLAVWATTLSAQPAINGDAAPSTRTIDRPVGDRLHPGMIFLDVAWERARVAQGEEAKLIQEAFVAAQLAQRSLSGSTITKMSARLAEGQGEFAKRLRQRQETFEEIETLRNALASAIDQTDPDEVRRKSGKLQALAQQLAAQDNALEKTYPDYARLVQDRPIGVEEVRQQLKPSEALVYVANGDRGVYVFVVTADGVTWHRAGLSAAQIEEDVAFLRCQLEVPACNSKEAATTYDRVRAFRLYNALLGPAEAKLSDKTSLITVSNRSLSRFPWAALVTEKTDQAADADAASLRATRWLVDKHGLITAPSPAAFYHLRTVPSSSSGAKTFAGFGNPILDDPPPERKRARVGRAMQSRSTGVALEQGALKQLFSDLPFTGKELEALRRAMNAPAESVFAGAAATESQLKALNLADVDVLAFATHGVLGGELPEIPEPALIFTPPSEPTSEDDGVLTASEAAKLNLGADLVILSACNTAGPGDSEGPAVEGLSGLARAFFFAGAKSLLVSHWPVYDEVAARLTVSTVAQLQSGRQQSLGAALQRAMIAARNDRARDWAHPSAWAPFVLVGSGG